MIKICSKKTLLFFLVTVFLSVQWTATHIHLAEHHDHDGNHHQHNIQAHAHNTPSHHADTIDSAHVTDDSNVVELDNDCTSPGWKKAGDQFTVFASSCHSFLFVPQLLSIKLSQQDDNKQNYHAYSTIRLRAPPQIS